MKNTKVKRFSTVLALSMMLGGGVLGLGLPAGTVTHSSAATVRSAHHLRGPHSLLDLRRRRPNVRWANIADMFSHLLASSQVCLAVAADQLVAGRAWPAQIGESRVAGPIGVP
jgi:hypothetical protein